ncbi:MAG: hypothetical protein HC815_05685 [Richelia sp. RM1_1_1]|nr:hypothetical protein [Richelia sp. RM1_1_1]
MKDIKQPSNNLDEIYQKSEEAKPELTKLLEKISKETGGKVIVPPLKGRERTEEKIAADYNGDASKIKDVLRASIVFKNMDGVQSGLDKLQTEGNVVATKDRFVQPTSSGYRDALLNIQTENGIIAEVQIHLEPILEAKKEGHIYYEEERGIQSKAVLENRDFSNEETKRLTELKSVQKELYDNAFNKAQSTEVNRSEITKDNQQWAENILPTANQIFNAAKQSYRTTSPEAGVEIAGGNTYNLKLDRNSANLTISDKSNREVASYNLRDKAVITSNPNPQDKKIWADYSKSKTQQPNKELKGIEV